MHKTMKAAKATPAPITAVRSQRDTQGDHPPTQLLLQMRRSGRLSQGRVRPARRSSDNTFTHSIWEATTGLWKKRSPTEANVGLLTYWGKSWRFLCIGPGVKILHPSNGSFKPNLRLDTPLFLFPPMVPGLWILRDRRRSAHSAWTGFSRGLLKSSQLGRMLGIGLRARSPL